MREYDNVDYRYKRSDKTSEEALAFISGVLGFRPDPKTLEYDLNFFSGGIGVDDKLAFSCPIEPGDLETFRAKMELVAPLDAIRDASWVDDFAWLLKSDGSGSSIVASASAFINENKKEFQSPCTADSVILFARDSDVNTWTAVWQSSAKLNYLYSDQG
jgi:hypothetical protein